MPKLKKNIVLSSWVGEVVGETSGGGGEKRDAGDAGHYDSITSVTIVV